MEFNICGICLEKWEDPRSFTSHKLLKAWYPDKNPNSCNHIYCYECYENLIVDCLVTYKSILCPLCRFELIDYIRLRHWYLLSRCFKEAEQKFFS